MPSQSLMRSLVLKPEEPPGGSDSCPGSEDFQEHLSVAQIVNQSRLAERGSASLKVCLNVKQEEAVEQQGLLALPDSAICAIAQYLDEHSQLQLAATCKPMAQAVFTRQQQQAALVIQDMEVEWDALLDVLSWMPVTAWQLGCAKDGKVNSKVEQQLNVKAPKSGLLLDRLLGLSEESILTSDYAAINQHLKEEPLLHLWSTHFSGGTWKPALQHASVVNVTLQGMELAFVVPPALAIACPNIKKLTLVSCTVGRAFDDGCRPRISSTLAHEYQAPEDDVVRRLVLETVCNSLEALGLEDTYVCSKWYNFTPGVISQILPNLIRLRSVRSAISDTFLKSLCGAVNVLEHQEGTSRNSGVMLPSKALPVQLAIDFKELHTLSLPRQYMRGSDFAMLERLPKLRTLAVYDFEFLQHQDYRQHNTHLHRIQIHSDTIQLATLGRLPLQSLKHDPISGRPCLTVMLPYTDSVSETARAINNLKGCCTLPISVGSLSLEPHRDDKADEVAHTAMLFELLTTFHPNRALNLRKIMLGSSVVALLEQLKIRNIETFVMDRCLVSVNPALFWQKVLQQCPNLKSITVMRSMWHSRDELLELVQSVSRAWAPTQHHQMLSVTVCPCTVELHKAWLSVRPSVPPAIDLLLDETKLCIEEETTIPSLLGTGLSSLKYKVNKPPVIAKLWPLFNPAGANFARHKEGKGRGRKGKPLGVAKEGTMSNPSRQY